MFKIHDQKTLHTLTEDSISLSSQRGQKQRENSNVDRKRQCTTPLTSHDSLTCINNEMNVKINFAFFNVGLSLLCNFGLKVSPRVYGLWVFRCGCRYDTNVQQRNDFKKTTSSKGYRKYNSASNELDFVSALISCFVLEYTSL